MKEYQILHLSSRLREGANRYLIDELTRAGLEDITTACGDVFHVLFLTPKIPLKTLAERIRRTKSTTSVMVDRLERLGYVERRRLESDGRVLVLDLTEKGRALKPKLDAVAGALNERIVEGFSDEEARTLERLLAKAAANFKYPIEA